MTGIRWIASYPKSGNTWLRCMLAAYTTGTAPRVWDDVYAATPVLEGMLRFGDMPPLSPTAPRLVKTHLRADVPVLGLYAETTAKVLYLVRNPRDIILSAIRMAGISPDDRDASRAFAREFIAIEGHRMQTLAPGAGIGSWPENVRSWTESARDHFPNADVLTVRYEDLRADPVGRFTEIVAFLDLGRPVEDEDVRRAVAASTLDRMRELEVRSRQEGGGTPPGGHESRGGRTTFVGEGRNDQSLAFLGADIEAAYQELVHGDADFARFAKQYGYAG